MGVLLYWLILFTVCLLPQQGKKNKKTYNFIVKFIPLKLYEWRSGIRKQIIITTVLYTVAIIGGIFNIWIWLFAIILTQFNFWQFYYICEPRSILEAERKNGSSFLINKLWSHLKIWLVYTFPVFCIAIFQYDKIVLIGAIYLITCNNFIQCILLKYAYYFPNTTSKVGQITGSFLLVLSLFPPLAIFMAIYNLFLYGKAVNNLNIYLHAYN